MTDIEQLLEAKLINVRKQLADVDAAHIRRLNDLAEVRAREDSPDDLRSQGWAVVVHNDYRQSGEQHTFWVVGRNGRMLIGEGKSDADALNAIRKQVDWVEEDEALAAPASESEDA